MSEVEKRLQAAGLAVPEPAGAVGAYVPAVRTGNLVFISGQGPVRGGQVVYAGKVGAELTLEEGAEAARLCALNLLAALRGEIGDLDRVSRVVKIVGWVNSAPGFDRQPQVLNAASEMLITAFGERGRHARAAVGANELPLGFAVEIEGVFEVSG